MSDEIVECTHCNGEGVQKDTYNDNCRYCMGTGFKDTDSIKELKRHLVARNTIRYFKQLEIHARG